VLFLQENQWRSLRIIDILPVRSQPDKLLLPFAFFGCRDKLLVTGNSVEIGHTQAGFRCFNAGFLEIIRNRCYGFTCLFLLTGYYQGLGGVNTGDDYIIPGIKELFGNQGGVRGYTGNVEPETDPADLKFQFSCGFFQNFGPGVTGTKIG